MGRGRSGDGKKYIPDLTYSVNFHLNKNNTYKIK